MLFPPDDTAHPLGRDFQDFIRDRPSSGRAIPNNGARPLRRRSRPAAWAGRGIPAAMRAGAFVADISEV